MAAKSKIKFEQIDNDPQTGCAMWEIRLATNGVYEIVGMIEKNTVWCGDGYRADSYNVTIELEEDESKEECFSVSNVWNSKGMSARKALAACKAFAREQLKNKF